MTAGSATSLLPRFGLRPVALLILFAATARAGVVTADFVAFDHLLITAVRAAIAADHLQFRQFLFLLALDVASEVLDGSLGDGALLLGFGGIRRLLFPALVAVFIHVERQLRASALTGLLSYLKKKEQPHRFVFDAVHHG